MSDPVAYLLLFAAGSVAGTINVLAGGGSFLTLPLLIFLGLPPTVANGTNRIAILVQNVGAVWSFNRHGVMDWRWIRAAALPALAGAGLGTWAAIRIGDASFQRVLATLMIVFATVMLLDPLRNRIRRGGADAGDATTEAEAPVRLSGVAFSATFFGVGVYGGFVQAGVGFLILSITMLAGLDLVRGNALKFACIMLFTPLSLAIFIWQGMVDWGPGLCLAAGSVVGSEIGVRMAILKGHRWLRVVINVTVIAFAVLLWFG